MKNELEEKVIVGKGIYPTVDFEELKNIIKKLDRFHILDINFRFGDGSLEITYNSDFIHHSTTPALISFYDNKSNSLILNLSNNFGSLDFYQDLADVEPFISINTYL